MSKQVEVYINNVPQFVEDSITLEQVLKNINVNNNGIAIAVNNAVIPKQEWSTKKIKEKDKILIIKATQGG